MNAQLSVRVLSETPYVCPLLMNVLLSSMVSSSIGFNVSKLKLVLLIIFKVVGSLLSARGEALYFLDSETKGWRRSHTGLMLQVFESFLITQKLLLILIISLLWGVMPKIDIFQKRIFAMTLLLYFLIIMRDS